MRNMVLILILLTVGTNSVQTAIGQKSMTYVELGIRLQKSHRFYWENGFSAAYRSSKLLHQKLAIGINFLSSQLGTALISNAIRQEQYLMFGAYQLNPSTKRIHPYVQFNVGYLKAHLNPAYFQNITNTSWLSSLEIGAASTFQKKMHLKLSMGYNVITGNGSQGVGSIYPLFFQGTAQYVIHLTKNHEK